MPVVINDFEIVVEPPTKGTSARGSGAGEESPPPQSMLKPEDIILVEQLHRERMERVRAD